MVGYIIIALIAFIFIGMMLWELVKDDSCPYKYTDVCKDCEVGPKSRFHYCIGEKE